MKAKHNQTGKKKSKTVKITPVYNVLFNEGNVPHTRSHYPEL